MGSPNQFWLQLHYLAQAYDEEGLTPDERMENIKDVILRTVPTVQRQMLSEMAWLVQDLPDIYPVVLSAVNVQEQERRKTALPSKAS